MAAAIIEDVIHAELLASYSDNPAGQEAAITYIQAALREALGPHNGSYTPRIAVWNTGPDTITKLSESVQDFLTGLKDDAAVVRLLDVACRSGRGVTVELEDVIQEASGEMVQWRRKVNRQLGSLEYPEAACLLLRLIIRQADIRPTLLQEKRILKALAEVEMKTVFDVLLYTRTVDERFREPLELHGTPYPGYYYYSRAYKTGRWSSAAYQNADFLHVFTEKKFIERRENLVQMLANLGDTAETIFKFGDGLDGYRVVSIGGGTGSDLCGIRQHLVGTLGNIATANIEFVVFDSAPVVQGAVEALGLNFALGSLDDDGHLQQLVDQRTRAVCYSYVLVDFIFDKQGHKWELVYRHLAKLLSLMDERHTVAVFMVDVFIPDREDGFPAPEDGGILLQEFLCELDGPRWCGTQCEVRPLMRTDPIRNCDGQVFIRHPCASLADHPSESSRIILTREAVSVIRGNLSLAVEMVRGAKRVLESRASALGSTPLDDVQSAIQEARRAVEAGVAALGGVEDALMAALSQIAEMTGDQATHASQSRRPSTPTPRQLPRLTERVLPPAGTITGPGGTSARSLARSVQDDASLATSAAGPSAPSPAMGTPPLASTRTARTPSTVPGEEAVSGGIPVLGLGPASVLSTPLSTVALTARVLPRPGLYHSSSRSSGRGPGAAAGVQEPLAPALGGGAEMATQVPEQKAEEPADAPLEELFQAQLRIKM